MYGNPALLEWMLRHADDFAMIGPHGEGVNTLKQTTKKMEERLLLRDVTFFDTPGTRVRFLGAIYTRLEDGFMVENDPSVVDEILADAGMAQATHFTQTPGAKEKPQEDSETDATTEEHSYYRTQVGRLLYLGPLRSDMQHTVGQLARHVQKPKRCQLRLLKRCIRYLAGTRKTRLYLRPKGPLRVTGSGDSNWADDMLQRRSCSGGCVFLAGALILTFSRVQTTPALSSCEAELYAMGSIAKEVMFLATFLREQGLLAETDVPTVYSDSSSAVRTANRIGLSRMKHIELRYMALQHWRRQRRIQVAHVPGDQNVADFLTKYTSADIHKRCCDDCGLILM